MKRFVLFFVLFVAITLSTNVSPGNRNILKIKKVVIDAGHGGQDPGAVGKKAKEKDITLSVALKLGNYIKTNFPDVEVIYTRKTDVFVELYNRAKIANSNKADLFISIHCNASKNTQVQGTETWVMGIHKSQENLEVARKENSAILYENNYSLQYDGFDPNSPEAYIIFSLYQNVYLEQSLKFASNVQKQFASRAGRIDRGVKQAGFLVLYKTTMPGALIEIGFISNPEEEEFLMSENGQNIIASGIYRAFKEYKNFLESGITQTDDDEPLVDNNLKPPIPKDTSKTTVANDTVGRNKTNNNTNNEIFFRVQFLTSTKKKPENSPEFKDLMDVRYYIHNNTYKYTCGNFKTLKEAADYQQVVQSKGFKDAFVVAFLNETRISPSEAIKLLQK